MHRKFAPSSAADRRAGTAERPRRARDRSSVVASAFVFACAVGCSPVRAEVASDPPALDGSTSLDAAARPGDVDLDGARARCDEAAPLRLYAWNLRTTEQSADINTIFKIENATGASLALSTLEVRYYFTNELAQRAKVDVFYTDTCCSDKVTDFNDAILTSLASYGPKAKANTALIVGFTSAAPLLRSGDAVQVEVALHEAAYATMLDQSNDYSFAAGAGGTQSQWNECPGPDCDAKFTSCLMTVHREGAIVWGFVP